jgi:hypothetical protein
LIALRLLFAAAYEKLARESREKFEPALDVYTLSISLSCSFQEYGEYDSRLGTCDEDSLTITGFANLDFYLTFASPLVLLYEVLTGVPTLFLI